MLGLTKMLSSSPIKTTPKTTTLQQEESLSSSPPVQAAIYKSSTTGVFLIPKKMTAKTTPVEIGTKGTVASLIMQEIEYFSKLELECQVIDKASTSNSSVMPRLGSVATKPKKKKRAGSRLIPSMCDMVEVVENKQPKTLSGFTYRNLKAETNTPLQA